MAIQNFKQVVAAQPQNLDAHIQLADMLASLVAGNHRRDGPNLPELRDAHTSVSAACSKKKKKRKKNKGDSTQSRKILQACSSMSHNFVNLGFQMEGADRHMVARQFHDLAVLADPTNSNALVSRFKVNETLCDWHNRIAEARKVMRIVKKQLGAGQRTSLMPLTSFSQELAGPDIQKGIAQTWSAITQDSSRGRFKVLSPPSSSSSSLSPPSSSSSSSLFALN